MALRYKDWRPEFMPQLSTAFWKQYAPDLAGALSREVWNTVILAYTSVDITISGVLRGSEPKTLIDAQVKGLTEDIEKIGRALASPKPLT